MLSRGGAQLLLLRPRGVAPIHRLRVVSSSSVTPSGPSAFREGTRLRPGGGGGDAGAPGSDRACCCCSTSCCCRCCCASCCCVSCSACCCAGCCFCCRCCRCCCFPMAGTYTHTSVIVIPVNSIWTEAHRPDVSLRNVLSLITSPSAKIYLIHNKATPCPFYRSQHLKKSRPLVFTQVLFLQVPNVNALHQLKQIYHSWIYGHTATFDASPTA
jgi:hypothetical protein